MRRDRMGSGSGAFPYIYINIFFSLFHVWDYNVVVAELDELVLQRGAVEPDLPEELPPAVAVKAKADRCGEQKRNVF